MTLRGLCYTDVTPCIRPDLPEHINKLASWILGQGTRRTEDRVEDMDTSEGSSDLLRLGHANSMCDMLNKVWESVYVLTDKLVVHRCVYRIEESSFHLLLIPLYAPFQSTMIFILLIIFQNLIYQKLSLKRVCKFIKKGSVSLL